MGFRWLPDDTTANEVNPLGLDANLRAGPQMREYVSIADRIAREQRGKVLDWGCGWGQLSDLMLRRGLDVEAFDVDTDIDSETVRPLEQYPQISVRLSPDLRALPYPDHSFDAALSCGVLEHVVDPDASLEELRRVLRPGGTLYVYKLPNRFSYLEKIAKRAGLYYHGKLEHDRLYTPATARKLIERHGFQLAEVRHANMLPLVLPGSLANRIAGAIWQLNRLLARVPGLNVLATNVELVALAPR
jgi:2-polyprenyl-3-methyl-5-hydroxy-6-metoxy-1,4-benzoquinol methylase